MIIAAAASSGISATEISAIVAASVAIFALIGGIVTYFLRRRGMTGSTDTSEAGTLWQQSQAMFIQITAERDKAIDQRDRLMTAQSDQVIPILSALLSAVQQLKSVLDQRDKAIEQLQQTLNELSERNLDVKPTLREVSQVLRMMTDRGPRIDRTAELVELMARKYGVTVKEKS